MSRRNNVTEPIYGQIKLKCPRGHDVGVILVQPRRLDPRHPGQIQSFRKLGTPLRAPKIEKLPDGKIESPPGEREINDEGRMEEGNTVEANCKTCRRPYWAFWEETVEPKIAELADTPVVTLTLDDDPLC